jgi:protein-disulfide isomerase
MIPFYREKPTMQPSRPTAKRRPILGVAALCAIAAAGYWVMTPEKPLVLSPTVLTAVTPADSFRRVAGSGARTVHTFISVDCSFCRKVEPEFQKLDNVTVHYHLLPGHSASARQEARQVWCAPDPAKAWASAARGVAVVAPKCDDAGLDRNLALALKLGIRNTPAMVLEDGRVLTGAFSTEVLEREIAISAAGSAQ